MTAPAIQEDAAAAAMASTYMGATGQLRNQLSAFVGAAFGQEGYRDAGADAFIAAVQPAADAANQTMAGLTDAYLTQQIAALGAGGSAPVGMAADLVTTAALRGVDAAEVLRRPYVQLWTDLSQGKAFPDAVAAAQRRAESIVLTDLQLAKTHTARAVMKANPQVVGYRRVLTGPHNCGMCVVASSVRYHKADLMPIHPGCVPAGTRISASGVVAVTRRRYTGELVVIRTSAGDKVTVTANHPVLTDQGWIPGHLVSEGDNVVRSQSGHRMVGGGPHESHSPALIEDVWRAASVSGFVLMPIAAEDFHGDGTDGEVDVVWTDGNLAPVGDVTFGEPVRERALMGGEFGRVLLPSGGHSAPLVPGVFPASGSGVSSRSLRGPLLGGHLCGSHQAGLGAASDRDTALLEKAADSAALESVLLGQGVLRGTAGVLGDDLFGGEVTPRSTARRFDPPATEFLGEGRDSYASLGRSLLESLAGTVELDRVVEVRRVDSSTSHVYNLHTTGGWYSANSHIVSNCDCAISVVIGNQDPGLTIDTAQVTEGATATGTTASGVKVYHHDDLVNLGDLLEPVHLAVEERFGRRATDARAIDYRKVITVHRHGELGPVLTVTGHRFTKKQIETGNLRAKPGTFGKRRR